jgi:molybdopterin/thiamine biosynthesis adenylyltransferase
VTRDLAALAEGLDESTARAATMTVLFHHESSTNVVTAVDLPDGQRWTEPAFQEDLLFEGYEQDAVLVRWPENRPLPEADTRAGLVDEFKSVGLDVPQVNKIVLLQGSDFNGYSIREDNSVRTLSVIPPQEVVLRVDDGHKKLSERKVCLVGCGSLGSKVAAMLARAGVGQFLLIDDDLLLPDNFVRHDLDWRDAGTHKVDSVARRLQLVNPALQCEKRRHRLGGQEASGSIETLLEAIAKCDLIIDCTADASVFNYLCAGVAIGGKPLLWAEVFAGGIGGMIARSRPQIDPDPATMRLIIESWWHDRGQRRVTPAEDYGATNDLPMMADDADVTVIAAHAARMGTDLLIPREPSAYPHSAYMIGLGKGGIFDGAFDTYPIDVGASAPGYQPKSLSTEETAAQIVKIATLLTEHRDANSPDTADSQTPPA